MSINSTQPTVMGQVVFLCWSGTRSRKVAEALDTAIRKLKCGLEPFRSPGIEKGSVWFEQVRVSLDAAEVLIVCVTPENARTAWIHYEAGAVAAKMASKATGKVIPRVYPYLFQMNGVELTGPLAQFQSANATEEDTLRLFRQLIPDSERVPWEHGAHEWWETLELELHKAEDCPLEEILPDLESLFCRKTFDERLDDCVNQAWPARWSGACETHQQLKDKLKEVSFQCRPYARDLLQQLVEAVDGYAMALELLVSSVSFELKSDGRRDVPAGLLNACERRREEVKDLISSLADPRQAPVFEDSPRFQALARFSERKALVHQFEAWLDRPKKEKKRDWRLVKAISTEEARTTRWHFDRIGFYLYRERKPPTVEVAVEWLRVELEKTRAEGGEASHMPLTYCLAPLQKALDRCGRSVDPEVADAARRLLEEVCDIGRKREENRHYSEPSGVRVEAERTLKSLSRNTGAVAPMQNPEQRPRIGAAKR